MEVSYAELYALLGSSFSLICIWYFSIVLAKNPPAPHFTCVKAKIGYVLTLRKFMEIVHLIQMLNQNIERKPLRWDSLASKSCNFGDDIRLFCIFGPRIFQSLLRLLNHKWLRISCPTASGTAGPNSIEPEACSSITFDVGLSWVKEW